jgi:vacuolar-type H+-ATPase subunit H
MKLEYIDQLELLKENLSSNSFLNNRSNKKDILKLVENLIDLMPVELRTARFIVREQELYLKKAKEEAEEILSNADKESSRLISESFVLQEAVVEANALVKQAEQEAILSRANVEDKLDNKLEEIKSKIDELSDIVEREKTNLRQPRKITEPE